jgi:hypothetical protein
MLDLPLTTAAGTDSDAAAAAAAARLAAITCIAVATAATLTHTSAASASQPQPPLSAAGQCSCSGRQCSGGGSQFLKPPPPGLITFVLPPAGSIEGAASMGRRAEGTAGAQPAMTSASTRQHSTACGSSSCAAHRPLVSTCALVLGL